MKPDQTPCRNWLTLAATLVAALQFGCVHRTPETKTSEATVAEVRKWTKAGKPRDAFEAFGKMISDRPGHLAAHRGWVEAATYVGLLNQVIGHYQTLMGDAKQRWLGAYGLGLAEVAAGPGHMEEALSYFSLAEQLMPSEADVPYRIGLVHAMNGKAKEAETAFARAIALNPNLPSFRVAMGNCLLQLGRKADAIEIMRPILLQNATTEEMDKARIISEKVFDPNQGLDPEAVQDLKRAMDHLDQDAVQQAMTDSEELIKRHPQLAFAYTIAGMGHSRLENNAEAIVAFERSLELDPNSPLTLIALGDVYQRLEQWHKARDCYERSLSMNPFEVQALLRLGELAEVRQDRERAERAYASLVLLDPANIDYRLRWAMSLVKAERLPEAVAAYHSILERQADNLEALVRLGSLHLILSQRDVAATQSHRQQAKRFLHQAQELSPENQAVTELLGKLEEK